MPSDWTIGKFPYFALSRLGTGGAEPLFEVAATVAFPPLFEAVEVA
jgi:hypothetical protein